MKFPKLPFFKDRRTKERFWIVLLFFLVIFFGFLEGWFFQLQPNLPLSGNILLFALINLNVILLLLLAYLVIRNIVKLVFERKRSLLGTRIKIRLVVAFVGLSIIPMIPLFWLATQFIFSSLDYWFSHRVEQSLEESVSFAKDYLEQAKKDFLSDAQLLKAEPDLLVENLASFPGKSPAVRHLRQLDRGGKASRQSPSRPGGIKEPGLPQGARSSRGPVRHSR